MNFFTKFSSTLIVIISYSTVVFANGREMIKTLIFDSVTLQKIRSTQPDFLKGLILNRNQLIKIEQDETEEILDIRVFDIEVLGSSRVDERT